MSSAKLVAIVKKLLNVKKIGHAGTLDPLATGVLPLAIGEATKLMSHLVASEKTYLFSVKFGSATSTADKEGLVIAQSNKKVTKNEIEEALVKFSGKIMQKPPIFSAIKIDGKRAYDLAREGKINEDQMVAREVSIFQLEMLNFHEEEQEAEFRVNCSKGTYVRSLAVDLATEVGSCGHVSQLRREKVGKFEIKDTLTLDLLEKLVHNEQLNEEILPMDKVLDDIPALTLSDGDSIRLKNGQKIALENSVKREKIIKCYNRERFFALAEILGENNPILKPLRVFNISIKGEC